MCRYSLRIDVLSATRCQASALYLDSCLLAGVDLREHTLPIYLWSLRSVPLAGGASERDDMRRRAVGTG